jgi:hypothetical protein
MNSRKKSIVVFTNEGGILNVYELSIPWLFLSEIMAYREKIIVENKLL